MTPTELERFLVDSRAFVNIASLDAEGWPMVHPAWYAYEDGHFYVITKERAGFCRNLRRDPRTTLLIASPEAPYRRVFIRGDVEFVDEPWEERARRMVLRYLGPDGIAYFEATLHLPRTTFRVRPARITTWNGQGVDRTFYADTAWHAVDSDVADAVRRPP